MIFICAIALPLLSTIACRGPKEEAAQESLPTVRVLGENANTTTDTIALRGQVLDPWSNVMIGANVFLKEDEYVGADTDMNGEFVLVLPKGW